MDERFVIKAYCTNVSRWVLAGYAWDLSSARTVAAAACLHGSYTAAVVQVGGQCIPGTSYVGV